MNDSHIDAFHFETRPYAEVQSIKDASFPSFLRYRQLLVTGPPGAGKSTLIHKIGGWPDEGYVDLSLDKWWAAQSLSLRPREVHLGFPCQGFKDALAVFDEEWNTSLTPPELDLERIVLPPPKRNIFSVNWRNRYVFEFLIPPAETLYQQRLSRKKEFGRHHVDKDLTLEQVINQVTIYQMAALYFHQHGMLVYTRERSDLAPLRIVAPKDD